MDNRNEYEKSRDFFYNFLGVMVAICLGMFLIMMAVNFYRWVS